MDFHYSPEDEAFRSELRTWLEANAPQASRMLAISELRRNPFDK